MLHLQQESLGIPDLGYQIGFGLRNLVNDYDVRCSASRSFTSLPSVQEWNYCGVYPEDAPFLPVTWFNLDWDTHILEFKQTCNKLLLSCVASRGNLSFLQIFIALQLRVKRFPS
jgi:hypothetical protein